MSDDETKLEAFNKNCKSLYILEWQHEVHQLLKVKLQFLRFDNQQQDEPYSEKFIRRHERDIAFSIVNNSDTYIDEMPTSTTARRLWTTFLGPLDILFASETPKETEYRRRLGELRALKEEIKNMTSLEIFLKRTREEQKLQRRENKSEPPLSEKVSSDLNFWDFLVMTIFSRLPLDI